LFGNEIPVFTTRSSLPACHKHGEREIIVMMRWTGLAPWEFEFPFPGSLTSTFLMRRENHFSYFGTGECFVFKWDEKK